MIKKYKVKIFRVLLISVILLGVNCVKSQSQEKLEELKYLSNIDSVANGKRLMELELIDNRGKLININKIESEYLVIYFWSTYCKPCLETLNKSKTLINEFENIKFVFISIDEEKSRWERLLKKRKYKGIHLYTNESKKPPISYLIYRIEFEGEKLMKYQEGVPTILLLDKDKKIIENDIKEKTSERLINFLNERVN